MAGNAVAVLVVVRDAVFAVAVATMLVATMTESSSVTEYPTQLIMSSGPAIANAQSGKTHL